MNVFTIAGGIVEIALNAQKYFPLLLLIKMPFNIQRNSNFFSLGIVIQNLLFKIRVVYFFKIWCWKQVIISSRFKDPPGVHVLSNFIFLLLFQILVLLLQDFSDSANWMLTYTYIWIYQQKKFATLSEFTQFRFTDYLLTHARLEVGSNETFASIKIFSQGMQSHEFNQMLLVFNSK